MSIFSKAMKNVIAARERQAQRYVARYMSTVEDATIKTLGKDRNTL